MKGDSAICENNQEKEIKRQLKKLRRLIKQTNDPVKPLTSGLQSVSQADFWWFRPRWWVFFTLCVMFLIGWWAKWPLLLENHQNDLLRICLRITVPILVIGISVTTLAHRLGASGQLTAEYLHEACRLPVFACQSFFSVILTVGAFVLSSSASNQEASVLTYVAVGGTVAIIPFFLFIILTLIRCANPQKAIEATTRFSTTWLVNAFAKDACDKITKELAGKESDIMEAECQTPPDEHWENHFAKVQSAFEKAVNDRSLESVQAWLDCTIEPIHRVFDICRKLPEYQKRTDYDPSRLYKTVEIYEWALMKLLALEKKANLWFVERGTHRIVKAVHNEVYRLSDNHNYTCLRPLCWIVVRLYKQLLDSEYANELRQKRAYFGSFYKFISYHLAKLPNDYPRETKSDFRQIFHEGLSLWLRNVVRNKDEELAESLCEAGRDLVFGDQTIDLKEDRALLQHLVLTGKLISDRLEDKAEVVTPKSLKMLFPDRHAKLPLSIGDLAILYGKSRPTVETDLWRFVEELGDAWERTHYDPLTGSGSSRGTRYHGGIVHLETGFLYAAALTLESNPRPDPIPIDLTHVEKRLNELKNKHAKLETNGVNVIGQYLGAGVLDNWIGKCKKKYDEEDGNA